MIVDGIEFEEIDHKEVKSDRGVLSGPLSVGDTILCGRGVGVIEGYRQNNKIPQFLIRCKSARNPKWMGKTRIRGRKL